MCITFNSKTFKICENTTKCKYTEERNVLFSQFILMCRKDRLIPYNTSTKKECEPHHFRFPPNLVELLLVSRKENLLHFLRN